MATSVELRALWIEQIQRCAREIAEVPGENFNRINDSALCNLDYLLVDTAEALAGREGS